MAKFLFALSTILLIGYCQAGCTLKQETEHAKAINAKLCAPGGHPNSVAQPFFDCYQESVTPGGTKFVECQQKVYGVLLNTEANLDMACNASQTKFRMYAACLMTKLVASGRRPSDSMHKLNQCQGGVVGVPAPK